MRISETETDVGQHGRRSSKSMAEQGKTAKGAAQAVQQGAYSRPQGPTIHEILSLAENIPRNLKREGAFFNSDSVCNHPNPLNL